LIARGVRHFVAAAALAAAVAFAALYGSIYSPQAIHSDGYSYYVYLPSAFIYHDLTLEKLAKEWYGGPYPPWTGLRRWPSTGRWLNLHPMGRPSRWRRLFPDPYVWSNRATARTTSTARLAVAYFLFGIAILRRMLGRQFSDGVVLTTLICITWGTNLFHYAVFDGTFSHAYAFFLVCVWVWLVERWWDRPTVVCSLAIGAVAALNVLVRHTNVIFALVLPLYGIVHWRDLSVRALALRDRWRQLALAALAGSVVVAPQLALYKWITGEWFVNAYVTHGMRFTFLSPHLIGVLFSTQKGLFFWSPILLLSVPGVFLAKGQARAFVWPALVVFALQAWLIASWPEWQFGSSYGHRGFTDGFALAAPFIASTFAWAASHRKAMPLFAAATAAAVLLSVAQMIQYWIGVLPEANTTWAQYQDLFLRFR
jgi:hypothetical protein